MEPTRKRFGHVRALHLSDQAPPTSPHAHLLPSFRAVKSFSFSAENLTCGMHGWLQPCSSGQREQDSMPWTGSSPTSAGSSTVGPMADEDSLQNESGVPPNPQGSPGEDARGSRFQKHYNSSRARMDAKPSCMCKWKPSALLITCMDKLSAIISEVSAPIPSSRATRTARRSSSAPSPRFW
jgi:hypothetical protein